MGKTRYQVAKDLLLDIKNRNGVTIPFKLLRLELTRNVGADKNRTVKPYLDMMLELEMIKPTEDQINVTILI